MSIRKKRLSDVLRQETQQSATPPSPTPTTTDRTEMNQPKNSDESAKLQIAQNELQEQVKDLQGKLKEQVATAQKLQTKVDSLTKELSDAKGTIMKLSAPGKAAKSGGSMIVRPTQTRAETAIHRSNTDIGWMD